MLFGDWIPDNPIDSIINKGKDIIDGATDKWEETVEFVSNNDKIESAVDLGEDAYGFGKDALNPVDGDEPPEGLENWFQDNNFDHCATLDLTKTCWNIDAAALAGATGFTVATGSAGAVTYAVPKGITEACLVISGVDAVLSDADDVCNPTNLYVFCPNNPADNQEHPIPPVAVPHCK
ncbi:hypothetical protein SAMN04489841_3134 [Natrinema salaciae]|uniref:Uncharacterized protein n=2 Tax=Natrinema salaciae TaxID=1186196 RepID=A0A1H9LYH0_9EURY|nr:hypothetical protein SAMN04489841_3134 [Natrinema salaciae]